MRSLPENEMFNALENRLRNYAEAPDDDSWDNIAGAIASARAPGWTDWMDRAGIALTVAALLFIIFPFGDSGSINNVSGRSKEVEVASLEQDESIVKDMNDIKLGDTRETTPSEIATPEDIVTETSSQKTIAENATIQKIEGRSFTRKGDGRENAHHSNRVGPDETALRDFIVTTEQTALDPASSESPTNTSAGNGATARKEKIDSVIVEKVAKKDSIRRAEPKTQEEENKKRRKKEFRVYASITPTLSYWHLTPKPDDDIVVDKLVPQSIFSPDRLGVSIEAGTYGRLSKRLEYYAGLTVYHQKQNLSYLYQQSDHVIVEESEDDMDYVIRPVTEERTFKLNMLNIGLQSGIMYTLKEGRLAHKFGAGLTYQVGLLRSSGEETYDNSNSSYLSYQLFYRNEYQVNRSFRLFFQPSFSRTFYATEKLDEPFSLKTSRAGFSVGVTYQFAR